MMEEWRELRLSFGQELTPKILLLCSPHLLWKETNYPCVPWVTQFPQQWAQIIKSKDNLFFLHLNTKDWIFYLFPLLLLIPPLLPGPLSDLREWKENACHHVPFSPPFPWVHSGCPQGLLSRNPPVKSLRELHVHFLWQKAHPSEAIPPEPPKGCSWISFRGLGLGGRLINQVLCPHASHHATTSSSFYGPGTSEVCGTSWGLLVHFQHGLHGFSQFLHHVNVAGWDKKHARSCYCAQPLGCLPVATDPAESFGNVFLLHLVQLISGDLCGYVGLIKHMWEKNRNSPPQQNNKSQRTVCR